MQEETQHRMNLFSAARKNESIRKNGFALPVVITIGLFMMIAGFAMMARTFGSFRGSIKNNQQQQAQELAEQGVSEIIDQLNSDYRYLWVNCHQSNSGSCTQTNIGGWNNSANKHGGDLPQINVASCLDIQTNPPTKRNKDNYSDSLELNGSIVPASTEGIQAKKGRWELESYTFQGNPWMGGRGTIRVRGERTKTGGDAAASAVIEHQIEVKGKPCGNKLKEKFLAGTFPGLLAKSIDLGNNDVIGYPSANVYCTECPNQNTPADTANDMGKGPNSNVDGNLFAGAVALPPVPIFPPHLEQYVQAGDLTGNTAFEIDSPGLVLTTYNPKGYTNTTPMCVTDEEKVLHCKVKNIDLKKDLIIKTYPDPTTGKGTRPVRIYLDGDIKAAGQAAIKNNGNSTSLSIFGICSSPNQSISMNGGSQTKAFIYAPCASVGINGGSTKANCLTPGSSSFQPYNNRSDNPEDTQCKDGDFEGAVWAKEWNGSNTNNGEITVPFDIEDDLITIFGEQFSIGPSDFVGVGVPRWTSYQEPQ